MRCLFLDALQDSWRAEVELVEQEIIRVNRLQAETLSVSVGKSSRLKVTIA
jgi:hypothetical protein